MDYFAWLTTNEKFKYGYPLNTAASIAGCPSNLKEKNPVEFDEARSAMLQWTNPSAGIMNPVQKVPSIPTKDTSFFMAYEFEVGAGCLHKGSGYLPIVKAWRIDSPGDDFFYASKLDFGDARKYGPEGSVAEYQITSQTKRYLGPGTGRLGEILIPRLSRYYCFPERRYRAYHFLDGNVGGRALCNLSVWIADGERVAQTYDKLALFSPIEGISTFRFEFNTSAKTAKNPKMEYWNKNLAVLHGVTEAELPELLRRVE